MDGSRLSVLPLSDDVALMDFVRGLVKWMTLTQSVSEPHAREIGRALSEIAVSLIMRSTTKSAACSRRFGRRSSASPRT